MLRFQLACAERGACLPFLAYARIGVSVPAPSCGMDGNVRAGSAAPAPAVRPGERATAVLVGAGLRMTASVTCLERGASGEIILVRGREGRIFRARVAGPGQVEATLP